MVDDLDKEQGKEEFLENQKKLREQFKDIKHFDIEVAIFSDYNLVSLLDKELEANPNRELSIMCNDLLFYRKQRQMAINSADEKEKAPFMDSYFQKLYLHMEQILIQICTMSNKEAKLTKISELKSWVQKEKEKWLAINKIKERTEKNVDEQSSYEEEEEEEEEEKDERKRMAKHRSEIPGFERASKRLKEYDRKTALLEGKMVKDNNRDHFYFTSNLFRDKTPNFDIYTSANSTMNSTWASCHFFNAKNNKGKDHINLISRQNQFNKTYSNFYSNFEIKSSYSRQRPDFNVDNLIIEKEVQKAKNKMIQNSRTEQEIKGALKDFGIMRARYKQNANYRNEMNNVIESYTQLIAQRKQQELEEEERLHKLEEEETKSKKEEEKNNIEEEKEEIKEEEKFVYDEKINSKKVKTHKVKYITDLEDEAKEDTIINKRKSKMQTINLKVRISRLNCISDSVNKTVNHAKTEAFQDIAEGTKKSASKNIVASTTMPFLRSRDKIINARHINSKLNSLNIFEPVHKIHITAKDMPMSFFDRSNMADTEIPRRVLKPIDTNPVMKEFNFFKTDFLNLRKSYSRMSQRRLTHSLNYRRGNDEFRNMIKGVCTTVNEGLLRESRVKIPNKYYLMKT
ncbi:MAG: hypothetical protein MJ252_01565, partial [archaeon]|nr:hypothetical protein [archaeon]